MSGAKNIVLGVTGSIAAYKAADLTSRLTKQGANVNVVMTADALRFITPLAFNTLAKLAHGIADDALTCIALALNHKAKLLIGPAMNGKMWLHPATRQNVAALKGRGVEFIGPEDGMLSCGYEGLGRLWEVEKIAARALELLV